MEDVLTSSVFALLRYLPPELGCSLLASWADLPIPRRAPEVQFWPRHSTPPGFGIFLDATEDEARLDRGESEPDVVVRTKEWLVLVEVKYGSQLGETYDQLSREFAIGYQLAQAENRGFKLLVLTANVLPPTPAGLDLANGVQLALRTVRDAGGAVADPMLASVSQSLRWTSWRRVYESLLELSANPATAEHIRRLLADTCQLLEVRGLKPYSDRPLVDAVVRLATAGISDDAWRLAMPYRYRITTSMSAGWQALLALDATSLQPLPWQQDLACSEYDLTRVLGGFKLRELEQSCWQPY
jgi:hypothetical protein